MKRGKAKRKHAGLSRKIVAAIVAIVAIALIFGSGSEQEESSKGATSEEAPLANSISQDTSLEAIAEAVGLSLENSTRFDPQNRESGYYRSEYRLSAWNNSEGNRCPCRS